jgi:hypothetical protein
MYFEVSGVTVSPLIPFLVAFFVSMLVASAGVSGLYQPRSFSHESVL